MPQGFRKTRGPVRDVDYISSVREPEAGKDFLPPDPDRTAFIEHRRDIPELLEQIEANTRKPEPEGVIWVQRSVRIPASAGELTVNFGTEARFLFLPESPRAIRVYVGESKGLYLAALAVGQTLQAEVPVATHGLFIEYDAGTEAYLNVYLSSKKVDVNVY